MFLRMRSAAAALSLCLMVLSGCAGTGESLGLRMTSTRIPQVHFAVAPPLTEELTGTLWGDIPSEVTPFGPYASMAYILYTEKSDGPVDALAYTARAQFFQQGWIFSLERPTFNTLSTQKFNKYGQFWTGHTMAVPAQRDWFSAMLTANDRPVPTVWLAMRYSATPQDQTRILAEYREAAPDCIAEAFQEDGSVQSGALMGRCPDKVAAFTARAEAALEILPGADTASVVPRTRTFTLPQKRPDMGRLVGFSEPTSILEIND